MQSLLQEFELPSFPAVAMEALRLLRQPGNSAGTAAKVLEHDPGLSSRLLQVVNSPAFGLRHGIRSVHHAASLLGPSQLECLLISVTVKQALPRTNVGNQDELGFWRTAARRGALASALAHRIDPSNRSEAFTAALLSDMALPLLVAHRGAPYEAVLEEHQDAQTPLVDLEQQQFGWDHAEIAAAMCQHWAFPDGLTAAIAGHHTENVGIEAVDLVAEVRDDDVEPSALPGFDRVQAALGLDVDETTSIIEQSFADAEPVVRLFC